MTTTKQLPQSKQSKICTTLVDPIASSTASSLQQAEQIDFITILNTLLATAFHLLHSWDALLIAKMLRDNKLSRSYISIFSMCGPTDKRSFSLRFDSQGL